MERRIKKILRVFPAAFLALLLYVILHEGGHTIVALLAGSRITEFNILFTNAHISFEGGHYSPVMEMWRDANGALLPLIISYVCAVLFRKDVRNSFYRLFTFVFCVANTATMVVWIVIPFLYLNGYRDPGEDAYKFVDAFSWYSHPLLVSAVALILMGIGVFLIISKGMLSAYISEIRGMKEVSTRS